MPIGPLEPVVLVLANDAVAMTVLTNMTGGRTPHPRHWLGNWRQSVSGVVGLDLGPFGFTYSHDSRIRTGDRSWKTQLLGSTPKYVSSAID